MIFKRDTLKELLSRMSLGESRDKKNVKSVCGCHTVITELVEGQPKLALVGSPNVGKSVIFNILTGRYVTVSNYPGTTVDISTGRAVLEGMVFNVIDTPGMYSLLSPITEEEKITRKILLEQDLSVVVHIVDAKNLERMLPLTLQLIDAGLPVVLVLNLMDEASRYGVSIDVEKLSEILGIPVIDTVAVEGKNIDKLKQVIREYQEKRHKIAVQLGERVESAIKEIMQISNSDRTTALLAITGNEEYLANNERVKEIIMELASEYDIPLSYLVISRYYDTALEITKKVKVIMKPKEESWGEKLSRITMHPVTGVPFFFAILLGFYFFVGVFGAQFLVDFLEEDVFGGYINPYMNQLFESLVPWPILQDLFVHEYGIITLGIRYAVAIIFPVVTTFFIAFSILEDSGYLPRLAMLIDRVFKKIGLNGRAVIPIVLGFGCDTMATLVTRTLETKRERVITTFLLALAIPCSAQLGVILALLAGNIKALVIWSLVNSLVLLLIGLLAAKVMPGERPQFFMEIPPLRLPKLSNILIKTWARVEWYFKEVLPLFIIASILIWLGRVTGVFYIVTSLLSYPVMWIGLPKEASVAILFGFFRRDYGAAGLYDLAQAGVLSGIPLVVSAIVITLFVPCIAQFSITWKERGAKTALAMFAFNSTFAFMVGGIVGALLITLGVNI